MAEIAKVKVTLPENYDAMIAKLERASKDAGEFTPDKMKEATQSIWAAMSNYSDRVKVPKDVIETESKDPEVVAMKEKLSQEIDNKVSGAVKQTFYQKG